MQQKGERMKQKIKILVVFLLIVTCMFSSCQAIPTQQTEEINNDFDASAYKIHICDISDSGDNSAVKIDYEIKDTEKYNGVVPQNQKEFTFNNAQVTADFKSSMYVYGNYYPTYLYTDKEKNEYGFDPDGMLASYFKNVEDSYSEWDSSQNKITEQEAVEEAKNFLSKITDISAYTITSAVNKYTYTPGYEIVFTKYIGEIETKDSAIVCVDYSGCVRSYTAYMFDKIPSQTKVSHIDMEQVKKSVEHKVKQIYPACTVEVPVIKLTKLKNGEFALYVEAEAENKQPIGENYIIMGHAFTMIVELT